MIRAFGFRCEMPDNHSKETRSYNMSKIRSSGNQPESVVRQFLFSKGLRYRKNDKRFSGCPDIVLPKYKTIIFVNGCFWHMHEGCSRFVLPRSNEEYWIPKLNKNKERDIANTAALMSGGWKVITIWECELHKDIMQKRLNRLYEEITQESGE